MQLPEAVPPSLWLLLEPVKAQQDRPSKSAATTAEVGFFGNAWASNPLTAWPQEGH